MTVRPRFFGTLLAMASGAALLSGCYSGRTWEAVQRIDQRTAELDSLTRVQRAELAQLRQDFGKQAEFLRSTKADTDVRVGELTRRLDVVVGKLEDNNERFSEVLQRMDIARRPAPIPADTSSPAGGGATGPAPPPATGASGGVQDPKPLYDAAYADFLNGRYELARSGFQQFVANYGQSELAGNAQYWIGETYYQEKHYSEAAAAFEKVTTRYPHNIKVPAALLKLGLSQAALGNRAAARTTLRRVTREFPGTDEARTAQQRLRRL